MSDLMITDDAPAADSSALRNVLQVSGEFKPGNSSTELRMPDGRILRLPTALFLENSAFGREFGGEDPFSEARGVAEAATVIPIVEESLVVGKRTVETGKVRLQKTVQEYEEALNEPLAVRTYDVERVILNRPVDAAPAVRHEGDTTVYPLIEEQLVLTKQLILKEEIRVTKRDTERIDTQVVRLRREHLTVERIPIDPER